MIISLFALREIFSLKSSSIQKYFQIIEEALEGSRS